MERVNFFKKKNATRKGLVQIPAFQKKDGVKYILQGVYTANTFQNAVDKFLQLRPRGKWFVQYNDQGGAGLYLEICDKCGR